MLHVNHALVRPIEKKNNKPGGQFWFDTVKKSPRQRTYSKFYSKSVPLIILEFFSRP